MRSFVEGGQADEDQIREFYTLQIRKWINTSLEEIESIDQEMVILRSRGTAKQVRDVSCNAGPEGSWSSEESSTRISSVLVCELKLGSTTAQAGGVWFNLEEAVV